MINNRFKIIQTKIAKSKMNKITRFRREENIFMKLGTKNYKVMIKIIKMKRKVTNRK